MDGLKYNYKFARCCDSCIHRRSARNKKGEFINYCNIQKSIVIAWCICDKWSHI